MRIITMKPKTCIPLLITFLWIALSLAGCSTAAPTQPAPLQPLTFMAGYKPQANLPFVGVYVAQELGFFSREGLDVTIEHSPGHGEHLQLTTTGKVQITTQDAAVLLKRRADPGLPLVSIALIGQRGQQAYAALASSGFTTPKDWEGSRVGYKGTPPPDLYAMLAAANADVDQIELINVGFDPRVLTEGKVEVYPVYKSNEPYLIQSWGYDLVLWDAAEYGVPTMGLTYVTSDATLEQDPELLAHFLRAALDGIDYAAQNIDQAVEIVLQYAGPETDRGHMRFMLQSELQDYASPLTEANGPGWQTSAQWQALADLLVATQVMPVTDVESVFTNQILTQAQSLLPGE